eukprot:Platyproteum_vivax@DN16642_c0_g1_i1.p2
MTVKEALAHDWLSRDPIEVPRRGSEDQVSISSSTIHEISPNDDAMMDEEINVHATRPDSTRRDALIEDLSPRLLDSSKKRQQKAEELRGRADSSMETARLNSSRQSSGVIGSRKTSR